MRRHAATVFPAALVSSALMRGAASVRAALTCETAQPRQFAPSAEPAAPRPPAVHLHCGAWPPVAVFDQIDDRARMTAQLSALATSVPTAPVIVRIITLDELKAKFDPAQDGQ